MEIRNRISELVLRNFHPPDTKHGSWWLNPDSIADQIIELLGVEWGTVYEVDSDTTVVEEFESEADARGVVADSPTDTGLVVRMKASKWEASS